MSCHLSLKILQLLQRQRQRQGEVDEADHSARRQLHQGDASRQR